MSLQSYIMTPIGSLLINCEKYSIRKVSTEQAPSPPQVCRACLSDSNLSILSKSIAKIFSDLIKTKYVLGNVYPQYLCTICLGLLKKIYLFQNQCHRSQKVMEKLHRSKQLSKESLKQAEVVNSKYTLTLSAIENTEYIPRLNLMYTKTLCIDVSHTHIRSNPNCDTVKTKGKKKNKARRKNNRKTFPSKEKKDIEGSVTSEYTFSKLNVDSNGPEDSLQDPAVYNGVPLYTDRESERIKKQKQEKQMVIEKQREMKRKRELERKKFKKRKNVVESEDSDTFTVSSCEKYSQDDEPDVNAAKQATSDAARCVEPDHTYAKPSTYKSERLNQRLKSNTVNRKAEYLYSDISKAHMKTKLVLGHKKKQCKTQSVSVPYKECKEQSVRVPYKECEEQSVMVEIPDENVCLPNDWYEETNPDMDTTLVDYMKEQSYDIRNSYDDVKPDVEELFVQNSVNS